MVFALSVRGDQLYGQLDLRDLRRNRLIHRRLFLGAMAGSIRLEDHTRRAGRNREPSGVIWRQRRRQLGQLLD
jgi:hypothetical protein